MYYYHNQSFGILLIVVVSPSIILLDHTYTGSNMFSNSFSVFFLQCHIEEPIH